MADRLLTAANVRDRFERLLSVEDAGAWKPSPLPYAYAAAELRRPPEDLVLVAVHPWDVDGAAPGRAAVGLGEPVRRPVPGDVPRADVHVVAGIDELAELWELTGVAVSRLHHLGRVTTRFVWSGCDAPSSAVLHSMLCAACPRDLDGDLSVTSARHRTAHEPAPRRPRGCSGWLLPVTAADRRVIGTPSVGVAVARGRPGTLPVERGGGRAAKPMTVTVQPGDSPYLADRTASFSRSAKRVTLQAKPKVKDRKFMTAAAEPLGGPAREGQAARRSWREGGKVGSPASARAASRRSSSTARSAGSTRTTWPRRCRSPRS